MIIMFRGMGDIYAEKIKMQRDVLNFMINKKLKDGDIDEETYKLLFSSINLQPGFEIKYRTPDFLLDPKI